MKRIAVFGTHGAAKTSLVYKLAAYFKMANKNVTVIHETARQCPFPINKDAIYKTTLHLVSTQLTKELEADAEGFEIAISDRTLYDAFVYINCLERGNEFTESLQDFCMLWMKQYDVLVYLEPTEGFAITSDGIRCADVTYQCDIRDRFRSFIDHAQKHYNGMLNIIHAESNTIFNEQECNELMNKIHTSLFDNKTDS